MILYLFFDLLSARGGAQQDVLLSAKKEVIMSYLALSNPNWGRTASRIKVLLCSVYAAAAEQ